MKADTTELCRLLQAITVTNDTYSPARMDSVQEVRSVEVRSVEVRSVEVRSVEFRETDIMANDKAVEILRKGVPVMEDIVQDAIEFLAVYDKAVAEDEEEE